MAEITNNKKKNKPNFDQAVPVDAVDAVEAVDALQAEDVTLEGFSAQEVTGLLRVKQAVAQGRYSDITPEYRKLLFVKWLIEHERIGS
jgi:hypothetical protein